MAKDKLYESECAYCKNKIYVRKSIGHEMGFEDMGMGKCAYCGRVMNLKYDEETDKMTAYTPLQGYDMSNIQFPMAVIYHRPLDVPQAEYMIRIYECIPKPTPTEIISIHDDLEGAIMDIRAAGFRNNLGRTEEDDPVIVESWIK